MGCNKDGYCYNLYRTIYPKLRTEVDASAKDINKQVTDIIENLNGLKIPEDYLGDRVKERVRSLIGSFNEDITSVKSLQASLCGFIDTKIGEHQQHYKSWQYRMQKREDKTVLERIAKE